MVHPAQWPGQAERAPTSVRRRSYHVEGLAERREFFETLPVRRRADGLVIIALSLAERRSAAWEP
ncbi:hypothetical protein ABZ078_42585 [Streptomyces sp. NPDC006385]|uniref:hypothetical protein n=1 Tax=Streptomyces sp. NPDC006385 TaxID=3156761 RepID=UPI0033AF9A43